MGRTNGSISSAGSLTFSDTSAASSRFVTTPPGSPRSPEIWMFGLESPADSVASSSSSNCSPSQSCMSDDNVTQRVPLTAEAADALARLNLVTSPSASLPAWTEADGENEVAYDPFAYLTANGCPDLFTSETSGRPNTSALSDTGSNDTAVEGLPADTVSSTSSLGTSTTSQRLRRPALRMDLSQVRPFDMPSSNYSGGNMGAPLIGCLPTPSPTTSSFGSMLTPRPGLHSRFSDESSSPSPSGTPELASSQPSSPTADKRTRLFGPSLSPSLSTGSSVNGPMTPRTADALNCFGIVSQSAPSMLMSRSKSRDKSNSMLGRLMPRSPLGLPPTNNLTQQAYTARSGMTSAEAKKAYHQLFPGEKARFGDLLATPSEEDEISFSASDWAKNETERNGGSVGPHPTGPVNPYFATRS